MPVVRNRLNNRRQVSTVSLVWPPFSGSRYHVTVGEYEDGRPGEVWVHGAKVGSEIDALLDDASILMSVLIQVGYDTRVLSIKEQPLTTIAILIGVLPIVFLTYAIYKNDF